MLHSLFELLSSQDKKNRPVYKINNIWYTINDIVDNSKKFASALKEKQICARTKTLLIADDSIEWIFTFWALHVLGAEIFVLTDKTSIDHVKSIRKKYDIEKIITDKQGILSIDDIDAIAINQISIDTCEKDFYQYLDNDVIINFATSGTGGAGIPKFVPHTLKNVYNVNDTIKNFLNVIQVDCTSTILCSAKMSFSWGFGMKILAPLLSNTKHIMITSIFSYKNLQDECSNNQVTNLILNPYLLKIFNRSVAKLSLRSIVVGGEPLPLSTIDTYFKNFSHIPLFNCYGLTETLFTIIAGQVNLNYPGSIGTALPNVLLKVIDENNQNVRHNDPGRLAIKTSHQLSHYADHSDSDAFVDGWFHTRDIVKIDENYNVIFVGRSNSCIKVRGRWHSLLIIEDAISNIEGIDDCVVWTNKNHEIIAHILKSNNANTTEKDIMTWLKNSLIPNYLIPKIIVFVDTIDKTYNYKKIRKNS